MKKLDVSMIEDGEVLLEFSKLMISIGNLMNKEEVLKASGLNDDQIDGMRRMYSVISNKMAPHAEKAAARIVERIRGIVAERFEQQEQENDPVKGMTEMTDAMAAIMKAKSNLH